MAWITVQATRYPAVAVTLGVGLVGLLLELVGPEDSARWVLSAYALVIAVIAAWSMVKKLLSGHAGLDILAVAAILATIAVGEYWASLVIVLMLSGGKALEQYAGHRARRELRALLDRAPQSAHLLVDGDVVADVPIDDVVVGHRLVVHPGEVVPVDGILLSEAAAFDESQLTGESLPVEHGRGDALLSGSVNGERAVTLEATAIAAESQYQRVVQLVREASESRAPLVRLADRYAVPFTLVSFAIAGFAWYISGEPRRFAEVLVVATPCPLLIAAPVAFISGISRAARAGIIVKGGGTLEQLSRVRTVAFDKTGTLTHGVPEVTAVRPAPGFDADDLLSLAASAEQYSGHVLAAAVVTAAAARGLPPAPVTGANETTASGVSAIVDGRDVCVGKRSFIESAGIPIDSPPPESGQMAIYVAIDGRYAGDVILADRIRDNAKATLDKLAALGVRHTIMLTGDLEATARHIAADLGITEVRAQCLPEGKVDAVTGVTDRPVMMVGDGVNDAPVLAAADIGVAMGAKGSTAASESADVVIMLDDFSRVERAITIGRQTTNVALQAIWLGIALSVGLMVVATFGLLPAIVGAALQEVVDLFTILYALRALTERGGRRRAPQVSSVPAPGHAQTAAR
jgi:heavy metal translocating P-type ATPase